VAARPVTPLTTEPQAGASLLTSAALASSWPSNVTSISYIGTDRQTASQFVDGSPVPDNRAVIVLRMTGQFSVAISSPQGASTYATGTVLTAVLDATPARSWTSASTIHQGHSWPSGSLPAMKTIGVMPRTAGRKLPATGWAGALAALALICAGCGSPVPAGNSHNGKTGTLKVTVIQAGGPGLPGGGTPKQPVANAEVKVTSASTSLSSPTGRAGVATFRLPSGSYLVSVPTCGSTGKREVTVTAASSTSLTWTCPIP